MDQNEKLHSIQQVSTKLNIPRPTLRFWEKEFEGILQPLRTDGGQRRYTCEHIAIIEKIDAFKKAGLSLAEIKMKFCQEQKEESGKHQLDYESTFGIDILVERVTEAVKAEILKFLRTKEERVSRHELNT